MLDLSKVNNTQNSPPAQISADAVKGAVAGETYDPACAGKIKGNIGSSGKIYHMPGGSFYERTVPELCFGSEAEAEAAGFRKSSR